jgi:COP9 signalosome complex subunit 7
MEQAHARSLAALQQFIYQVTTTKNASPRFLANVIKQATEAPGTFVFTELLQLAAIQSLRADDTPAEFRAYLTILEIFSWATYDEYKRKSTRVSSESRNPPRIM